MANYSEPSSSISFTSPSHNGSYGYNHFNINNNNSISSTSSITDTRSSLEIISLNKLSCTLGKLLTDLDENYSDAIVVVEGNHVCIHRCILAARSTFFANLFKENKDCVEEEDGKVKYIMSDILPYGNVGYDSFVVFLSFLYTGKLKASPPEVSTCVHGGCPHDACRPAIVFAVELMYAAVIFQVPELIPIFQRRLLNFIEKALVEDVIPILLVAFHCELTQIMTQCVHRLARSDLDDVSLDKELPLEVSKDVKSLRNQSLNNKDRVTKSEEQTLREKRIRQIHKALDSDDVELVKLLLNESKITLDEAEGLHYAVLYCDPKVVKEVVGLDMADVNRRNARGYTVLHVAAMRKEPSIIVALLSKQVSVLDVTYDGRSAVGICKRLTRPKDYNAKTERGEEANKDRICIDLLEREIIRSSMGGDVPMLSMAMTDDLHMKLLHLENRVAFARLLFPTEARLAIESANSQTTSATKGLTGNLKVDLNETPSVQHKRLVSRIESLSKTVEMGRRFFPHCSEVLDKFMLDDLPDVFYLEKGTPEEQVIKRTRFVELKEDVQRAFSKDKAEHLSDMMHVVKNRSRKYS